MTETIEYWRTRAEQAETALHRVRLMAADDWATGLDDDGKVLEGRRWLSPFDVRMATWTPDLSISTFATTAAP